MFDTISLDTAEKILEVKGWNNDNGILRKTAKSECSGFGQESAHRHPDREVNDQQAKDVCTPLVGQ